MHLTRVVITFSRRHVHVVSAVINNLESACVMYICTLTFVVHAIERIEEFLNLGVLFWFIRNVLWKNHSETLFEDA